ncbi:MAG: helix-turn-helix transcriptional regulator [Leucobacter sp.]
MAGSRISSEARVFSLILALLSSTNGLTKHELLSSIYGYSDRYRDVSQHMALDRQFERDKEQLRSLGIPVETIDSPGEPGNNQLSRYRITKSAFEVPPGLEFSDRELMMLRMAALAWREGSLTNESRRATMKLESLGAGVDAPNLGVSAGFGATEPQAPTLLRAIEDSKIVEFAYQLADRETPLTRLVRPLQLHRFEGRWHLISFDLDRMQPRVFLLSRIVGSITVLKTATSDEALPMPADAMIAETSEALRAIQNKQRVTVRVRSGSAADASLVNRAHESEDAGQFRVHTFGTADYRELAVTIAGFGADAVVLDPPELRKYVIDRLRAMRASHTGADTQEAQ